MATDNGDTDEDSEEAKLTVDAHNDDRKDEYEHENISTSAQNSCLPTSPQNGTCKKIFRCLGIPSLVLALLYIFIISLDLLSSAFTILFGKTAGSIFEKNGVLKDPITGVVIGILATVLVQSSSASTSIVVTMVASGALDVKHAIPIIMGANIGTSVTNTLVSLFQWKNREEFSRAFAGATLHDTFNCLAVIALLPFEMLTDLLYTTSGSIVSMANESGNSTMNKNQMLKVITKPITSLIVQIDVDVLREVALGNADYRNRSLVKKYCKIGNVSSLHLNISNLSAISSTENSPETGNSKCSSVFSQWEVSDTTAGTLLLIISVILICVCLIIIVKMLHFLMKNQIRKKIEKIANADFPGCFKVLTGYVAILVGALLTIAVQSSSVLTSILTPLVGAGVLTIKRMYPLTVGSNIGTTFTCMLAAFTACGQQFPSAFQIALVHLLFNIGGMLHFYTCPVLNRIPISLASSFSKITLKRPWFPIVYLITMFVILPLTVFGTSMTGNTPLLSILAIFAFVFIVAVFITLYLETFLTYCRKQFQRWQKPSDKSSSVVKHFRGSAKHKDISQQSFDVSRDEVPIFHSSVALLETTCA